MTLRLTSYILLTSLSLLITTYAVLAYGFAAPGGNLHPDMRAAFEAQRLAIYCHIFASALALGVGPLQFSSRFRTRRPDLHRWVGRLYLSVGVLIGGMAGLFMAFHAFGGLTARLGFAGLALAWLYTGVRAYLSIQARDVAAHQRWMVRNFSLTFAAVTLRLWLPVFSLSGVPFEQAYPLIAWLCWLPNLLVAEMVRLPEARHASELR